MDILFISGRKSQDWISELMMVLGLLIIIWPSSVG